MKQTYFFSSRRTRLGWALISAIAITACGGSDDSATTTTTTVPGAPTIGAATAGDASASIAFTAPSSNGGAAITNYTGTCTGGGASRTATATASPVSVSGLTNATTYSCTVTATNSVGTSAASAAVAVTPAMTSTGGGSGTSTGTNYGTNTTGGTSGVACSYTYTALNSSASVNTTSTSAWTCNSTSRVMTGNGIPDHAVGTFPNPNNPNTISAQSLSVTYSLTPTYNGTATNLGGSSGATGYLLNGVKIDANTAGSCPANATATSSCSLVGAGTWSIEALGQTTFNFGTDTNNAHVQPSGEYHYHGMPEVSSP